MSGDKKPKEDGGILSEQCHVMLRDCPHCGSKVLHTSTENKEVIECTTCPAKMRYDGSGDALISMWNYRQTITVDLLSVDLEENLLTVVIPKDVMAKGFHAGKVNIDLSGVQ